MNILRFFKTGRWWYSTVVGLLFVAEPQHSYAAAFVPLSVSGSLSYSYGYIKSERGGEAEAQSITANIFGSAFIWQPWFITTNAGLSIGFSRSDSSTSEGASAQSAAGHVGFNVFPASRFPFSLIISHSDSRIENQSVLQTLASTNYTSTQILAHQAYKARGGYLYNLSYSHSQFESGDLETTNDSVNADARYRQNYYSWVAAGNYSTNETSNSDVKPSNWSLRFQHNYVPGNQMGVTSAASVSGSESKSPRFDIESRIEQASSVFSWRPAHKPFTFSGGARISHNTSESALTGSADVNENESNTFSLNTAINYRATRKVNVVFNLGGAATDSQSDPNNVSSRRVSGTTSLSSTYSSDQYSVGGFRWNWNIGGGAGATVAESTTSDDSGSESTSEESSAVSAGGGHFASRDWMVGRASSLHFTFSQNLNGTYDNEGEDSESAGTGASLSWSGRGMRGSTYLGINANGSFTTSQSNPESRTQAAFTTLSASRNQSINRLSSMTGNANLQYGATQKKGEPVRETGSAQANISYRHLRAFGVYALNYSSTASYALSIAFEEDQRDQETIIWDNRFDYVVGLLDLSLDIELVKQDSGTRGSLRFRATRSF